MLSVKKTWQWIAETKLFFVMIIIPLLAVFWCWLHPTEPYYRGAGLFMQLCGTLVVVIDIKGKFRQFKHISWKIRIKNWYRRRPWKHQDAIIAVGAGIIDTTDMAAGTATTTMSAESSVEIRLKSLEDNQNLIRMAIGDIRKEALENKRELIEKIAQETNIRNNAVNRLEGKFDTAQVENLDMSAIGLIWIVLGSILGTGSVEISRFFNG